MGACLQMPVRLILRKRRTETGTGTEGRSAAMLSAAEAPIGEVCLPLVESHRASEERLSGPMAVGMCGHACAIAERPSSRLAALGG